MIRGFVSPLLSPRIRLSLLDGSEREEEVEFVVDTGFDGELTLPANLLSLLQATSLGDWDATLADGRTVTLTGFVVRVMWEESVREVVALESDSAPLLGMELMQGSRLQLDVIPDGELTISPLD